MILFPQQLEYEDMQITVLPEGYWTRTVLSDKTDMYINENGRMVKIEPGYFYKRFCREQIEFYTRELEKCETDMGRDYYWR